MTLLVSAIWVLAVVARPYEWWRVALVAVSGLAYVVIFSIPLAREQFMLDPSNVAVTTTALVIEPLAENPGPLAGVFFASRQLRWPQSEN